jgi:hypothetical protein
MATAKQFPAVSITGTTVSLFSSHDASRNILICTSLQGKQSTQIISPPERMRESIISPNLREQERSCST